MHFFSPPFVWQLFWGKPMQKVLGCRILKKKHTIVRFISEDSGDFVTGSQKGNYLSWSWLSPFSNPNHSFKPTYSRQNSCPSPLKKCSRELRYRGNRIIFFFFFLLQDISLHLHYYEAAYIGRAGRGIKYSAPQYYTWPLDE